MTTQLKLTITPKSALIDESRHILVEGAKPSSVVEINSRTMRRENCWRSRALFIAAPDGTVDTSRDAPFDGDYTGVKPMGLIWSQRPENKNVTEIFPPDVRDELVTHIEVKNKNDVVSDVMIQYLCKPDIRIERIHKNGLVGTLCLPAGEGPFPSILILNGSGGGINEPRAAIWASHGYAAFALGYFKVEGLSNYISNTPLEYFKKGLDFLHQEVRPRDDFVAIAGQSRGGELALLIASLYPEDISAVIAYLPGSVVHSGQNASDPAVGRNGPAWLKDGKPLTHLIDGNRTATWEPFDNGPEPHRHELALRTALADDEAVERARIKVENIKSPIILLSATDDGSWPSSFYCSMVVNRLAASNYPYNVEWYDYSGAGHAIVFPYVPTTAISYSHPVSKKVSTGGGTPERNAFANEDSWNKVLSFAESASKG
ncbi:MULTISPECIES: acyl-CoA thioester hydrolase/BAAT C-terminal domain-containing protein [Bartonella]|uniref:acyl-CoA thioester hydrolase/BAAT C-terminal domain-containing protein n=1 Tax=Bartonella TaxID=773 RepID=UPI0018DBC272|nr:MULTISPECIES: acyl-CoA thioester hydrolase/BAAT C-terminal domain-containing protein [Bartonella]MBH9975857.1 acyl-CoA thioesterase/BAAT N-terminal domain-containing protein [Bartonella choladocola]MBI0015802.1 acyl-CoA thioesterase/BAAT N-terminal domain-containing protein [Bartonella sp. B10834G3]